MKVADYILAHWRGSFTPIRSLFLNGLVVYLVGILLVMLVAGAFSITSIGPLSSVVLSVLFIGFLVWLVVGTTRASARVLRNREQEWPAKLNAVLVLLLLYGVIAVDLFRLS
jgi:hypothetical protein